MNMDIRKQIVHCYKPCPIAWISATFVPDPKHMIQHRDAVMMGWRFSRLTISEISNGVTIAKNPQSAIFQQRHQPKTTVQSEVKPTILTTLNNVNCFNINNIICRKAKLPN